MNFPANSYKDLEMLILPTPILMLTRVIFSGLWRHLHSRGRGWSLARTCLRTNYVMWPLWVVARSHKPLPCQFRPRRIGDIKFLFLT